MGLLTADNKTLLRLDKCFSIAFVNVVSKQHGNITLVPVKTGYPWEHGKARQTLCLTPVLEGDQDTLSNNCGVKRLEAGRSGNGSLCASSAQLCPLVLILCEDKPVASSEHSGRELISRNKQKSNNLFIRALLLSLFSLKLFLTFMDQVLEGLGLSHILE